MGYENIKRPVLARNGLQDLLGSTFSTGVTFSGNVTLSADLRVPSETLTGSTAAQTLADHGVSFLTYGTSGKPNDFILPDPPAAGAVKWIFMENNTTSIEAAIYTDPANFLWGTTYNTIGISAASTGSPGGVTGGTPSLCLVGKDTDQWAILVGSTGQWDLSKTTGSTAQA